MKWFKKTDAFSATVDCSDLGYGVVEIRDPSTAQMNEFLTMARKDKENQSRAQAAQIRVYYVGGNEKLPKKSDDMATWVDWVNNAQQKVIARIVKGTNLLDSDDEEVVPN